MIKNIQILRAVAVLLVLFVHYEAFVDRGTLASRAQHAFGVGVDLFFVISGFVMVYSTSNRSPTPVKFMRDRLTRIAPLYWLMTCVTFIVALTAPSVMHATSASPAALINSLLFVPFARESDGLIRPILFVGWTLNCEMAFYLLFAIGLCFRQSWRLIFVGSTIAVAVILGPLIPHKSPPLALLTGPNMLEFPLGMALGYFAGQITPARRLGIASAALIPFAVAGMVWALFALDRDAFPVVAGLATLIVAGAVIMEKSGLVVRLPLIALVGDASYSIYLTHPFVMQAFGRLYGAMPHSTLVSVGMISMAYVGACTFGVAVYLLVEKRLNRAVKSMLQARPMIAAVDG